MMPAKNLVDVIQRLSQRQNEIRTRYHVTSLALFGSASRDQLREISDVDLVVNFAGPATFNGYFDLKFYLEEVLGREVDLATAQMLKPRFRQHIEDEMIYVA